jgi:hypothetical protein
VEWKKIEQVNIIAKIRYVLVSLVYKAEIDIDLLCVLLSTV